METYDMKPDAPADYRGIYRPVNTNVPGIDVCELLPRHTKIADKFTLIRSIAHGFADHGGGHKRFLTGRKPRESLDDEIFTNESYCRIDFSNDSAAQRLVRFLDDREIDGLDLLIHNAATGYYGRLEEQDASGIESILTVNLSAPAALTRILLPRLRRRAGKIVFVSSVVSALPCPDYAVYAASKAALDGLARSLRVELKGGVRVQVVHPGATRTGLHRKIGVPRQAVDWTKFPSAELTALRIAKAIEGNRNQVTIGFSNRLTRLIGRRLSRPLDALLCRRRAKDSSGAS